MDVNNKHEVALGTPINVDISDRKGTKVTLNKEVNHASFIQIDGNFIKKEASGAIEESQATNIAPDLIISDIQAKILQEKMLANFLREPTIRV